MNCWSKEITTRKTHNLASARAASCTQEITDNYFEIVTKQYQLVLVLVVIFGIAMKLVSVVIKAKPL